MRDANRGAGAGEGGGAGAGGVGGGAAGAGVAAGAARTPVKTFQAYLPPAHRTYSCIHCRAHLASHDELISKSFQGSQGRAYLFNSVVNVGCGPAEERVLLTGLHAVADIYCECCKTMLGWKYVGTQEYTSVSL
ncbi:Protein yippee-like 1 [Eumeta japonica]|uniref:Protein yippee-like 1 n=1 Tax=Eumeta variegata TaxID=151549 RepID=A0A4C1WZ26_EUMVA|nr:Protein yippee-like 1 [Eumeta japonica]